eukprot:CCRYP_020833-RA/>CCRYP_020833-RA protein AED:0.43 eAED:0.43 QI:0/0/0/1/0/0/2/0/225
MGVDIKSFYLTAPLDRYEYMKMPLAIFPEHTIKQYDLHKHAKNGFVYLEIRRCVHGLPMAGALANKLLRERLAPHGYYKVAHTPGLWCHVKHPISFTLVVDDFGVKYVAEEHAQHLIDTLKKNYKLAEDWSGDLYCGITLDWDYKKRTLDISLPESYNDLTTNTHQNHKTVLFSPALESMEKTRKIHCHLMTPHALTLMAYKRYNKSLAPFFSMLALSIIHCCLA